MHTERLQRLQAAIADASLDGYALAPGPSLFYLTGLAFHLMERPIVLLVPAKGNPGLIVPGMEKDKASTSDLTFVPFSYGEDPASQPEAFGRALAALGLTQGQIGVEPLRLRFYESELLRQAAPALLQVAAEQVVGGLRLRKAAAEVEAMRRAVEIAETAMNALVPQLAVGMTERQIAAELTVQLLAAGSDPALPFHPIVASGPNSALPHATAGERQLQPGEFLLIDWGASYQSYFSDLTRTFSVGQPSDDMTSIHHAVMAANEAGRRAVRPGVSCGSIDQAARNAIEGAGYGERFIHRTGHGLGLEEHEEPYLYSGNDRMLDSGMAFTIEPGIYLPELGGVRIEDNVVVTDDGVDTLSSLPRTLEKVG
ncbi:MAG TPA: Xaa-Pro peptidase family protein [Anaerolineales bacterium]|jgi:Xaa-Pro dipeptidase